MTIEPQIASEHSVTLDRGLGLFDVTMIGVGAMVGAGIFGLTGIAAGEAGPMGLLLAFFLNGVVTSLTGLTYAELGAAIPEAGGDIYGSEKAYLGFGVSLLVGFPGLAIPLHAAYMASFSVLFLWSY